ncbi:DUF6907 domain-containing protein [Streptomyces phaeochromogenes]|uniref:DUF6907 domain-containing protein n=1 Tax=Streptomyces phaeochromogenes TaxID=1923 RepID=UPI002DD7B532|nr:hypothetical protein [Streptomyces phaeochromogenes]WRZ31367.1 hypothetical protein OG931_28285 [Streptomyces phaeochromogenes]
MHSIARASTATSFPTEQLLDATAASSRTWTFTNSETGRPVTVTCMQGCTDDHTQDIATPTHPIDIACWSDQDGDTTLPIDPNTGTVEDLAVLATRIQVDPFSQVVAHRLPYACVEIVQENYIAVDPDGLLSVINTLAGRLHAMRRTHADLVRVRAEYVEREARVEGHVDRIIAAITTPTAEVQV